MYEYQTYDPLSGIEIVGVIVFLIVVVLFYVIFLRIQYLNSLPEEDFGEPVLLKKPEFYFNYSQDDKIILEYKGEPKMYGSVIGEKIYFFWYDSNIQAIPTVEKPKNHFMSVERLMRKALIQKMKPKPEPPKRRKVKEWDYVDNNGQRRNNPRFKNVNPNHKLEIM